MILPRFSPGLPPDPLRFYNHAAVHHITLLFLCASLKGCFGSNVLLYISTYNFYKFFQFKSWFIMINILGWLIMIYHDISWYIVIYHDTRHDISWPLLWYIMINHDNVKKHHVSYYNCGGSKRCFNSQIQNLIFNCKLVIL